MNANNFAILAYVIALGLIAAYAITLALELRTVLHRRGGDRTSNGGRS